MVSVITRVDCSYAYYVNWSFFVLFIHWLHQTSVPWLEQERPWGRGWEERVERFNYWELFSFSSDPNRTSFFFWNGKFYRSRSNSRRRLAVAHLGKCWEAYSEGHLESRCFTSPKLRLWTSKRARSLPLNCWKVSDLILEYSCNNNDFTLQLDIIIQ